MSDHNKMLIDRIKGMPAQPGDLSEEIGWLLQEIDEQKDELDRLRAEVSEWKMKYESEVRLVDIVEAELDRLRAENRALNEMLDAEKRAVAKAVKAVTAENERLRMFLTDMHIYVTERVGVALASTAQEDPCQPQD